MIKTIMLVLALIPAAVNAENLRVTINGISYHDDREFPYNETNEGFALGYGSDSLYGECGSYTNSFYLHSKYCSVGGAKEIVTGLKVGLFYGYFTGYEQKPIPVAAPYLQIGYARLLMSQDVYVLAFVFNIGG
jgi:hypothetical protein